VKGRGNYSKRGVAPLLNTRPDDGRIRESKGGAASLPHPSPFPLKERGIKGVR